METASRVKGEVRIEFGLRYRGDLATAPVSHRTALVAVCRARVSCVCYLTGVCVCACVGYCTVCILCVCVHVFE